VQLSHRQQVRLSYPTQRMRPAGNNSSSSNCKLLATIRLILAATRIRKPYGSVCQKLVVQMSCVFHVTMRKQLVRPRRLEDIPAFPRTYTRMNLLRRESLDYIHNELQHMMAPPSDCRCHCPTCAIERYFLLCDGDGSAVNEDERLDSSTSALLTTDIDNKTAETH